MLAFLAAIIPILGSLYAGGSFLLEHARLSGERRIRERVQALAWARLPEAEARAAVRKRIDPSVFHSPIDEVADLETKLLAAHGLKRGPSFGEADLTLAMSGSVPSVGERKRQTTVLLTATVGVIALALDAVLP